MDCQPILAIRLSLLQCLKALLCSNQELIWKCRCMTSFLTCSSGYLCDFPSYFSSYYIPKIKLVIQYQDFTTLESIYDEGSCNKFHIFFKPTKFNFIFVLISYSWVPNKTIVTGSSNLPTTTKIIPVCIKWIVVQIRKILFRISRIRFSRNPNIHLVPPVLP